MIEYKYTTCGLNASPAFPEGHSVSRTLITVSLNNGELSTGQFLALVDTGADYCVFPADFAEPLGLNYEVLPSASVSGVGEDQQVRFSSVRLELQGFGEWKIYAGFSKLWNGRNLGMLGHLGFLERFKITLDPSNGIFKLEELPIC
jgi:hypothetical protein